MTKTLTTISVDVELKNAALPLIRNKMGQTLSYIVSQELQKIVNKYKLIEEKEKEKV